jgi:hypothetical protein
MDDDDYNPPRYHTYWVSYAYDTPGATRFGGMSYDALGPIGVEHLTCAIPDLLRDREITNATVIAVTLLSVEES